MDTIFLRTRTVLESDVCTRYLIIILNTKQGVIPHTEDVVDVFGKKKSKDDTLTATYAESDDGTIVIKLSGRLDSVSSNDFQSEALPKCRGRNTTLDLEMVTYLSSAGLRAILTLDKAVGKGNKLTVINAKDSVKDVLDMSGFSEFI